MERAGHGEDVRLARALRRGDEAALAAFSAQFPAVYAFVVPRLAGDRQAAEDVTQETFLAAMDGLERYDGRAALSTWLCAIARHKVADHYRRLQRLELARLALEVPPEPVPDPADGVEREELRRRVVAALRALPAHHQRALTLKYLERLSGRQLAGRLGLSEDAAESLLARARAAFRRAFRAPEAAPTEGGRRGPA